MKKSLYLGISMLSAIVNPKPEVIPPPDVDVKDSVLRSVLDEIFSVDEHSGLPKGDIQYYLSKDGNPEVKSWLEKNLMAPRSVASGKSGVSDDVIYEFSRKSDETIEQYVERLSGIRDSAVLNSSGVVDSDVNNE